MKWKHLVHVFLIVILLCSGLMISERNSAHACTCSDPGSYEEALEKSDWVFDGVVTNKKVKSSLLGIQNSSSRVEWTFQVNGSWKGEVTELIKVYSAQSSDSCGYGFKNGKRYAVFARDVDGIIEVSSCSKTSIIADNSDIFTELASYKFEINVPPTIDSVDHSEIDPSSPDSIVKIATEEEVKQSIQDRKTMLMIAFVIVGLLFIVGAFVLIRRISRR
ncbi:hypothetical protein [Paenibacillus endoradicis]|uniref:hypothetical protein n=1 Tax=Paenibacillus endoradicis TaxID=2972487 RepID=UPI00215980E6|nr:hypothetical protein [Paenibacillus endoradicis]MCR8656388.1 hypothetical protein [Paenibacillus endoradicis]